MPSRFLRKCPFCGTLIHPQQIPIWESKGFPCPVCGERLRSSVHNIAGIWIISLLASAISVYSLTLRGWVFFLVTLLVSLPVYLLVYAIATFIFPTALERFPKKEDGVDNR